MSQEQNFDIFHLLGILKKRRKLLVISFGLLAALFVAVYFISQPKYKISLFAHSALVDDKLNIQFIDGLQELIQENDIEALAEAMGLPMEVAERISSINAKEMGMELEGFVIEVQTPDALDVDQLADGFKHYLGSLWVVQQKETVVKENVATMDKAIKEKLAVIDSMEAIALSGSVNGMFIMPSGMQTDALELLEQKALVDETKLFLDPLNFYIQPSLPKTPEKSKAGLVLALFAALFVAVLITWAAEFFSLLDEKLKNY